MCTPEPQPDTTQMREHLQEADRELDQLLKHFIEELGERDEANEGSL